MPESKTPIGRSIIFSLKSIERIISLKNGINKDKEGGEVELQLPALPPAVNYRESFRPTSDMKRQTPLISFRQLSENN
jgi:hypothetical protein